MSRKKTRSPERIIKLYGWLWRRARRRANHDKTTAFINLSPKTLTGRCIQLLMPQLLPIHQVLKSEAYRKAVLEIIHSN